MSPRPLRAPQPLRHAVLAAAVRNDFVQLVVQLYVQLVVQLPVQLLEQPALSKYFLFP